MEIITKCRACESDKLIEFFDLGQQYLSDFREDRKRPPLYPLVVLFCNDCKLVQLKHTVPQYEMYHQRYGFKSSVSDSIKNDLSSVVSHALRYHPTADRWLDIASNDGFLLSQVPRDIYKVGIDPVDFLCLEAEQHADEIINDYFDDESMRGQRPFDIITSISCFYDMPNPSKFIQDVLNVLADDGVWIVQQNYLLTTMQLGAVDNICHEHLEYYTLLSLDNLLDRFGLEVNEVKLSKINGGSIRTVISRKGRYPVNSSVTDQRKIEWFHNLEKLTPYKEFAKKAQTHINQLSELVHNLKSEGNAIAILAASTRGATIWQSANIDKRHVDYAVERNEMKVGKWFSAMDIPIISEKEAHKRRPDYMLVGPWFHIDEIVVREKEYLDSGGKLIVPLPEVRVL